MLAEVAVAQTQQEENASTTSYSPPESPPSIASASLRNRRRCVTPAKLKRLLYTFQNATQYPDSKLRDEMAKELDMTNREVQVWFQNQRAKMRRLGQDRPKHGMGMKSATLNDGNQMLPSLGAMLHDIMRQQRGPRQLFIDHGTFCSSLWTDF